VFCLSKEIFDFVLNDLISEGLKIFMVEKKQRKVFIIQKSLPQYRKDFFNLLREKLKEYNVSLVLIYGDLDKESLRKRDLVDIDWAIKISNKVIKVGKKSLFWQPCLHLLKDADLIIVEQASKLLLNYILLINQYIGKTKLCFWGHGMNLDKSNVNKFAEYIKRIISTKVHWWFAYNEFSKNIVANLSYPSERITVVQNSINTKELVRLGELYNESELNIFKKSLGIKGKDVCIFTGAMYKGKGLDFLIQTCLEIKKINQEFEMIFIGAGPDEQIVVDACRKYPWMHYVGPKFNAEKVPYFKVAKLLLIPSAIGLVALDSFALEVPIVTTKANNHGPEFYYLRDNKNAIVLEENISVENYAKKVNQLLKDEATRKRLIDNCKKDREIYTLEQMVNRFVEGILKALLDIKR
jgi:glycosyltransferase involved in cell wall biosynthesis